MSPGGRAYFASCVALCTAALAYLLPVYARLPRPIYDPVARHWTLDRSVGAVPIGYYGQISYALVLGALAFALTSLVTRALREPTERGYGLWAAWSLTALGVVLAWFAWNNWP
jgi:hypothetical protein